MLALCSEREESRGDLECSGDVSVLCKDYSILCQGPVAPWGVTGANPLDTERGLQQGSRTGAYSMQKPSASSPQVVTTAVSPTLTVLVAIVWRLWYQQKRCLHLHLDSVASGAQCGPCRQWEGPVGVSVEDKLGQEESVEGVIEEGRNCQ